MEADAFELLREYESAGQKYDNDRARSAGLCEDQAGSGGCDARIQGAEPAGR